jgi:hypothetical protein
VKNISGGGEGGSEEEIGTLGRRSADAMTRGKKLINDPNDVVIECIKGLVETYPKLTYLDGFPEVKVVLRADVPQGSYDRVAVISGFLIIFPYCCHLQLLQAAIVEQQEMNVLFSLCHI